MPYHLAVENDQARSWDSEEMIMLPVIEEATRNRILCRLLHGIIRSTQ